MTRSDPVSVEVIEHHLTATAEQMKRTIIRTAMHPIIYEVLDFSTAVFDAKGRLAAQASGLAIFLGTLDWAVRSVLKKFGPDNLQPGDIILTNDPYNGGGTHLSDVSVVEPIFHETRIIGFVASRAHWNDIGGAVPLSVQTNAKEIYAEGLILPVVKLYQGGRLNRGLMDMISANIRGSEHQIGDLKAQLAAAAVGKTRMIELACKYGPDVLETSVSQIQDAAEVLTRRNIADIPDGEFHGEDFLDDQGHGGPPTRIKVRIVKQLDELEFDFNGSAPANPSGYNMTLCSLVAACRIILKAIIDPRGSTNDGSFRPLTVTAPAGSVVNAIHPTPVSLYGEPGRRAIDAVLRALAPVIPDRLPAGHYGTIAGVAMAGWDDRTDPPTWASFQGPNGGGWGASLGRDGESALCCITNGDTRNTPTEIIEALSPLRVLRYQLRQDTGGAGQWRGGLGTTYEFEVLTEGPFNLTCALGRTLFAPFGVEGGRDGATNVVKIIRDGSVISTLGRATSVALQRGDRVLVNTGGGGGYGKPDKRDREAVRHDIRLGYITPAAAHADYGIPI